ncbi:MAG: alkaline phosphatase D family protein [Ilumatobacteraceae bacterium]
MIDRQRPTTATCSTPDTPASSTSSRRDRADLIDTGRLHVFVPAIMGVGLVFWLVGEVRDLARASIDASRDKQARLAGHAVARAVVGPDLSDRPEQRGLRSRPVYALLAITLVGGAVYVAVGSVANYVRPDGYVADIAWLLALALVVSAATLVLGVVAAITFVAWPSPPSWTTGWLSRSLLTTRPIDGDPDLVRPSWRLGASVAAAAGVAGLVTLAVGGSPHLVEGTDDRLGTWFDHFELGWWGTLTDAVFGTEGVVLVAVVVSVAALRCRALTAAYLGATGLAMAVVDLTNRIVERARPPYGPRLGVDSFPSGHVAQSAVMVVLLPLAVATLANRRRVSVSFQLVLAVLAVGSAVDRLSSGVHWPSDVVGGAAIGLALGLGGRWVVADQRAHVRCRDCPWAIGVDGGAHRHAQHLHRGHPAHPARFEHPHVPLGLISISQSTAATVRLLSALASVSAVLGLIVLTVAVGLPQNGEGYVFDAEIEQPVQLALAALVSIGAMAGRRWPAVGATVIALAAACLGVFAAIQHPPIIAATMAAALMVPAFLLWLSWQHRRTPHELTVVAVVAAVLVGGTWTGARSVYDTYFGPTHPESLTPSVPEDEVTWVLTGVPTPGSVTVTARLRDRDATAALLVHPTADPDGPGVRSADVAPDRFGVVRLHVDGLAADTDHTYRVLVDGEADEGRGTGAFHTTVDGPMSFTVVVGACARIGSNGSVFDAMAAEEGLFYLELGDIHYGNIDATVPGPFLDAFDRVLTRPSQAALYRSTAFAYIWDDHDYGPNDADSSAPGRDAVAQVYRSVVPSAELVDDVAIFHAFTVGRVRFVLTDTRSQRTDDTMLGDEQLAWLLDELVTSSRTHALVVWANGVPWIGDASTGGDTWAGYADERARISQAIADAGIDDLVMVSGDAHMVAIDDGTHTDYSPGGTGIGFPLLHAAALDRHGSVKGGPYSEGAFPGGGQYGVLEITDPGGDQAVTVAMSGRTWDGRTLVSATFELPAGAGE